VGGGIRRKLHFVSSDARGRLSRPRTAKLKKTKKIKGEETSEMEEGGVRAESERLTGER
jgi:hypothetical protein